MHSSVDLVPYRSLKLCPARNLLFSTEPQTLRLRGPKHNNTTSRPYIPHCCLPQAPWPASCLWKPRKRIRSNVGAVIIRIGFWAPVEYSYNSRPKQARQVHESGTHQRQAAKEATALVFSFVEFTFTPKNRPFRIPDHDFLASVLGKSWFFRVRVGFRSLRVQE